MALRIAHIIGIGARNAYPLRYQTHQFCAIEQTGILLMLRIGNVANRIDDALIGERRPKPRFEINIGHLLTPAKVSERCLRGLRGNTKGYAFTRSAAFETKHKTGPLARPAMNM